MDAICIFEGTCIDGVYSEMVDDNELAMVVSTSDMDYIGNELRSNLGSSSVNISSESNLEERHVVVNVKTLWPVTVTGE